MRNVISYDNYETAFERQMYITETIRTVFEEDLERQNIQLKDYTVHRLREIADRKRCDIEIYNAEGMLLNTSFASAVNCNISNPLELEEQQKIERNLRSVLTEKFSTQGENYLRSAFGLRQNGQLAGFIIIRSFISEIGTSQDIPIILSKLLNVYVFVD